MSGNLVTVEQAAEQLKLHPKTVLRYIREGRLQATRIGKAYRIDQAKLDEFAGVASGHANVVEGVRATCVVDIPSLDMQSAERIAMLLNAAALTGDAQTPRLHISTAFDPAAKTFEVVIVGRPSDAVRLLEMVELQLWARP